MGAQGINIGDGVLKFFGDTTSLDQSYAKIDAQAVKSAEVVKVSQAQADKAYAATGQQVVALTEEMAVGQQGAVKMGEVMTLAGEEAKFSMYEARGEVGLLGEEIGVKLPRHVRSFLVELPGVGAAMSAAFSITAVGFLITALVEISEKASEFAASILYGTEKAKENMSAQTALNVEILELSKSYATAKQEVDDYGKSVLDLAQDKLAKAAKAAKDAKTEVQENTAAIKEARVANDDLLRSMANMTTWQLVQENAKNYIGALKDFVSGGISFSQVIDRMTDENLGMAKGIANVDEETNKLAKSQQEAKVKQEDLKLAAMQYTKALVDQFVANQKKEQAEDAALAKQAEVIVKANEAYRDMELVVAGNADNIEQLIIKMPEAAKGFMAIGDAMRTVGIDTVDLQAKLTKQTEAVDILYQAYNRGEISIHEFRDAEIAEIETEIALAKQQGQSTAALEKREQVLKRSNGESNVVVKNYDRMTHADKVFQQTVASGGSKIQATWAAVGTAFSQAVALYASGSDTMAQATEKMIAAELSALSQWAIAKAIEETAIGFSDANTPGLEGFAAGHFESAALYGALGGAAAIAGHVVAGAASGSSSHDSSTSVNAGGATEANAATQTQAQPVAVVNVQRFAAGGLVSQPTLAIIGDSKSGGKATEAVIPLDDPKAMERMGGLGGTAIHVHVKGLISPDNLHKVIKDINRRVNKGQSHLKASDSQRVTRRSQ